MISPLVSKRHSPAVIAPTHRRISSATAPNTSDGSTAARDQRAHPPHGRLLGDEPAILGVQRDIVDRLVELPGRGFVGG